MSEGDELKLNLFGLQTSQSKNVIPAFTELFKENKFSQIIELGTGNGVFTILLGIYGNSFNCDIYTFDIITNKQTQIGGFK